MGTMQRLAAVAVFIAVLAIAGVDGCDKGACQVCSLWGAVAES